MLAFAFTLFLCLLFQLSLADTNITVGDSQIPWPSDWAPTGTTCSTTDKAHFAFGANMTIPYLFVGTAIYMRILRDSVTGVYTVSVDGNPPVTLDGYFTQGICDVQFGQTGLPLGPHTVTVTLVQQSPQDSRPLGGGFYLEIDNFIFTVPSNTTSSLPPATLPTSSPATLPTSPPAPASPHHSSLKTSTISGIVIGSVLALVAVVVIVFFIRRRSRNIRRHLQSSTHNLLASDLSGPSTVTPFNVPDAESQNPHRPPTGGANGIQTSSLALLTSSGVVLTHLPTGSELAMISESGKERGGDDAPPDYNSIQ